jgi:hypothetical protein
MRENKILLKMERKFYDENAKNVKKKFQPVHEKHENLFNLRA